MVLLRSTSQHEDNNWHMYIDPNLISIFERIILNMTMVFIIWILAKQLLMVTNIPPADNSSSRSRTGTSSLANENISETDSEDDPLNEAFLRGDSDTDDDIDNPDDTDDDINDSDESE